MIFIMVNGIVDMMISDKFVEFVWMCKMMKIVVSVNVKVIFIFLNILMVICYLFLLLKVILVLVGNC